MPQPNFVKIDIEGAELMALKGASTLLARARPTLYMEIAGASFAEITLLFKTQD